MLNCLINYYCLALTASKSAIYFNSFNFENLSGAPTNWGLKDMKRQELLKQIGLMRDSSKSMTSTYQASYNRKLCTGCPSK